MLFLDNTLIYTNYDPLKETLNKIIYVCYFINTIILLFVFLWVHEFCLFIYFGSRLLIILYKYIFFRMMSILDDRFIKIQKM